MRLRDQLVGGERLAPCVVGEPGVAERNRKLLTEAMSPLVVVVFAVIVGAGAVPAPKVLGSGLIHIFWMSSWPATPPVPATN